MSEDAKDTLTVNLTLTAVPSSPRVPVKLETTSTATDLRLKAAEATRIPLASLKIIYRGRMIKDDETLPVVDEYKLEDECVLHVMGKPTAAAASETPPASTAAAAGSSVSFLPTSGSPPIVSTGIDPLQTALNTLRSSNSSSVYLTAVTTLEKVLSNVIGHPMEEKYRRVKKQNAAFQRRLGALTGGETAMLAAGFILEGEGDEEYYVLQASPEAWPKLVETKTRVEAAVREAKAAASMGSIPPAAAMMQQPAFGGGESMIGMGAGMGAGGLGGPDMQNAMANLMQDPNALQSMLQNPMVRNMIQNDPRIANNPQMRQSLDALASNPQMLQQVRQMMSDPAMQGMMNDPAMRSQMQGMMNNPAMMQSMMQGVGGGTPAPNNTHRPAANNPPTGSNASGAPQQPNTNNMDATDEEMTEEEMIQAAIERSLRES